MKLTIKTENGQKVVDLKNDLQFNTLEGEQYVFSSGFSNYVLSFKDDQASVVLTFNVDGKSIKVELNGIVPHLQANTQDTANPTAIIINKGINNKDVDNLLTNADFNGGEIIDRLEAIISKPVELGDAKSSNVTLITDYQTLLESLGAAAAGGEAAAGNATSDGSSFNSIFSLTDGGLNDIAATDRWVNLTESISTIPVDSADTIAPQTIVDPINVNVKLVGVDTAVTEGENASYKVTLTDDAGKPVVATEDMEVTFTYTYTTAEGNDITETSTVIIKAGTSEAPVSVKTNDDVYAEGTEEFTIAINTVSNQTQFENVTVDKTAVVTSITDETKPYVPNEPDTKDNVNVKLVGVDTAVTEGENASYKVTLTDDAGKPVVATEDMEVTFTYTYTTAEGNDITETSTVIIKAGTSEAPVSVKTNDDVYAEGTEEFTIAINTVSNQTQFENVTVDKTAVVTSITDETKPYVPNEPDTKDNVNVKLVGVDTAVTEGENASYKVTLTDDAGKPVVATEDMEVTFTYTYTTAEGNDITETSTVIIKAGTSEAPVSVKTNDDVYAEGTEEFTIAINTVSNQTQFENVTVDKTAVVTSITDETKPYVPNEPDTKDNVNVKLVGVDTAVTEGENASYKVTLTDDAGKPVVATEDMEVTFTYTYTTAEGNDITETSTVIIKAGTSEAPVSVKTNDDVYAEGTEEFTIAINTVSNQTQFENVTVDKTAVVTSITDETKPYVPNEPDTKDNVNVKLVGVDTAVTEGENASYKVTLTDDAGKPVVATEDMEVTFTYTYTTAEGNDITETSTVIIKAGTSEAPVSVKTNDDVYAEGTEEFTIAINTVSNQTQFENVTVDKTAVVTSITDETKPYVPNEPDTKDNVNVKLVGVDTAVTEGENASYKVTLTDDAGKPVVATEDMEVTFTYTYTTAEGNDITETSTVIIKAGTSEAPVSVKTNDDVYAEGTEEFTIAINTVSNQTQFENVTVDKTAVVTSITDETKPYVPNEPDTKDNVNVKLVGVDTAVTEGENASYKVTLTDDAGKPVVATEDMEVTFTYTYTTAEGNDITETSTVIIKAGTSEAPVSVKTNDDVYAEGTEEFTIAINTVSNQTQFENVTVDKTAVVTSITDETKPYVPNEPDTKDNVNVKLVGVDTAVTEGENASYKVTLTDDAGKPVVATEDMEVTFTYTYTTAEGNDITETSTVIIKAGTSEAPVSVKTNDDVYAEGTEEFTIAINTVSNQTQFENVTVDKTAVVTSITDETKPYVPNEPDTKDNVNVKLVGVDTAVTEGENASYKVTLTDDAGKPVVATEDMEVTFTYTYTTAEGNDITETSTVIIKAGTSEAPVSVKTNDDVYAEGTEEFTIAINTVSNQTQFENVTVDKTAVVTSITDETKPYVPNEPDTKDNVNVKLVGVDTAVTEGENASYKVTLTDDAGKPVVATEDMEVTFTYTYTTAEGNDITETSTVIIKAGTSEAPVSVKTNDDVYAEGTEEFTIAINTVSNQTQFENVTVDKTAVVTSITDETKPYVPNEPDTKDNVNVKLVGVDTAVTEGENASYKVTLTDDAGKPVVATEDMEVTFTYTYTTAEGNDITETSTVIIKAGTSEAPVSVKTNDDVYAEGTEEFTIAINTVSNQTQFENVTVDKTAVVTSITDETKPYVPNEPDTKDNVNVKLVGVDTAVTEGENASYKVTLTDDAGKPVVATEDMEVTFTYTYTTAEGNDITETSTVIIKAGTSEAPVSVKTNDDVYAEGTEEFTIAINTVSNQTQFENVTVDKTAVVTSITDETKPYVPNEPDTKDNVNVKLVGVDTAVTEGENASYKVTLTDDAGKPVVATEDMEVTFTYTYTTAEGNDITETSTVIIKAGTSEAPVSVKTNDDVYAEGTEEFTIAINTVSNQTQFENVTVDKTAVVTSITDETKPYVPNEPDTKDNVNVKLVGVDTAVTEGENASYKVTLTDDAGKPVVATEDMEVTFTYTYTTAEGNDITETSTVIIKAGTSEAPVSVKTNDDVYAEGTEEFTIAINTVSNQTQFENVTVDKTAVVTSITDETKPYVPNEPDTKDNVNVKLVGVDTAVTEGENASYKVTLTDDAGKPVVATEDMEVTFTYTYTTAEGNDITETSTVIIKAGTSEAPVSVKTNDDVYAEGTEEFTIAINTVSNQTQFENVTVDKTAVVTSITDETKPYVPNEPDTKDNVNVKLVGVDTAVTEGENASYKVTLTDDAGKPVVATEDMEVTFTYTYTTAEGNDITETSTVIIKAGTSEAPVSVKTNDDVYAEGTEEFTIAINTVSNQTQFENVTVDKTAVVTSITDETKPYVPNEPDTKDNVNVKLVGVDTAVTEGENASYKVTLTDDAGKPVVATEDMEVTFTYTYTTAEGNDITETSTVIIKAGTSEAPVSVKTNDDVYAEGTEEFTIAINTVSNQTQFENVTVDKTAVVTSITDETKPYVPNEPDTKDNVNVKLVGVDTAVTEGENASYKVTLTDDAGKPVVATEDMEVTFTYTYTTAEGNDITETSTVIIKAGTSEAPVSVKTNDDVYAEGTEEFTIAINTVSNQTQFENVTVDKTAVVTSITDETKPYVPNEPDTKDNVNVKLVGVDTAVTEGENASYKVTLTDDAGKPVVATEDMEVTFTYTYTTAEGNDITETSTVIIKAGTSEAPVSVKTNDDVYAEGTEEFTIAINTVSNQTQFENVTVDKTAVVTSITDETKPYVPNEPDTKDNVNVKLVGVDTAVTEGENASYKVTLTDDAGKPVVATEDMEVTFTYTYTTAEGNDITETSTVIIKAGTSEAPVSVKTNDDNIYETSEEFTIAINTVSNQTQFENVTVDKTPVITVINDEDRKTPDDKEGDKPILIITGSTVTEKVNGVSTGDKVVGTVEISIENGKVFAEDLTITLSNGKEVIIKAGETTTGPIEIETNRVDDYYKQDTTTETVSIKSISNSKIDITNKTATITINDDVDPVDVTISATVTTPKIIDVTTATNGTTGVEITGYNSDGTPVDLSIFTNSDHNGFGIDGKNLSNGDSKELGFGEKIVVEFTDGKDVNSLDVSFAWRNNHETAKLTFIKDGQIVGYAKVTGDGSSTTKAIVTYYDENNKLIKTVNAKGSSDKVDEAFTFELPDANGGIVSFDKVEFSAPTNVDDYLINKIVYKEVINTEVTNVLTDDAKVTFNIQLDENYPPQGTATAKLEVNGVIYDNVIINATGRATLTVDGKDLGDLSKVVIKVLEINGGNYEKINLVEKTFDFTPVLKSSDDSITTNEDETYTLKVTDFGEVSVNTTMFKITELPINGKLFLTITMGDTIFNPDGTQTVATQNTKVEITKDQIISLAQIGAKKVEFVPNEDSDIDGNFKFEVGDGTGKFSGEYTTAIEVVAVADKPTASIDVRKILIDDINIKQLQNAISHVKYYLSDGTTLKIDSYANTNQNPSDPTKYISAIESDTGLKVIDYVIKAGTGVYDYMGTYLGDSIVSGDSLNPLSNGATEVKTYSSINSVYDFENSIVVKVGNITYDISEILINKGAYILVSNVQNNTESNAQNIIINESLNSNDFLKTSSSNNIIVIDGNISGGAKIEAMGGNDLIVILGDLINGTINDSEGMDSLYLSKSSNYYSWNVNVHSGETGMDGTITQYADIGHTQIIGTLNINNIEGIVFADGKTLGAAEIIKNSTSTVSYEVDLSADLSDLDGSETLTAIISGVPVGATFDSKYVINDNGVWKIVVPENATSINYSNVKMAVPQSQVDNIKLEITARATETNDNIDGKNYAESSDKIVYAVDETNIITFGNTVKTVTTNLVITLDVSASMSMNGITRFDIAKNSLINMINSYEKQGATNVNLTLFGKTSANIGWFSAEEAKTYITNLKMDSSGNLTNNNPDKKYSSLDNMGTNYEDAILKTTSINFTGHSADRTLGFFISDGDPTAELDNSGKVLVNIDSKVSTLTSIDSTSDYKYDGKTLGRVDTEYYNKWNNFIDNNKIQLNVVGIGGGISTNGQKYLNMMASANGSNAQFVVDNAGALDSALIKDVQVINGNVIDNVLNYDGVVKVDSIEVNGTTYNASNYTNSNNTVTIDNLQGKLEFNFATGKYMYVTDSTIITSDTTKTFKVNVSDIDGDKAQFDVNMKVDVTPNEIINKLDITGDDIDLSKVITKNTDVINLENSSKDKITIQLDDLLVQEDKQLMVRGDKGDIVRLDTPSDWSNVGKEQLDGVNYKVYTGTGVNSTIKLLIEDDIDITPDI